MGLTKEAKARPFGSRRHWKLQHHVWGILKDLENTPKKGRATNREILDSLWEKSQKIKRDGDTELVAKFLVPSSSELSGVLKTSRLFERVGTTQKRAVYAIKEGATIDSIN